MSQSTDVSKKVQSKTTRKSFNRAKRRTRFHLSNEIRRLFQLEDRLPMDKVSFDVSPLISDRIAWPSFQLQSIEMEQSMNIEILDQMRFVGQFDRKFLICQRSTLDQTQLILFDQHALSERILLEQLQNYFESHSSRSNSFHFSTPIIVQRNPRFLYNFDQIDLLQRIGFSFFSISNEKLFLRAVPSWLISVSQRRSSNLSSIISQTIEEIFRQSTSSMNFNLNWIIYQTLKSLACHNAIKFNDLLSARECRSLLNDLKSCRMPFICAHGRTSAALLWQYQRSNESYRVNWKELKDLASIHKWMKES